MDETEKMWQEVESKSRREVLRKYSKIYFLIGILELQLRESIPAALSPFARQDLRGFWHEGLPLTPKSLQALRIAIDVADRKRMYGFGQKPENYLPLSFWRYLIRSATYTELWIPALHLAFPNLENPKHISTYRAFEADFQTVLRIRNQVAHYEIHSAQELEKAQDRIKNFHSFL